MAGKEFKASDRKVEKMTKDGLVEENLRDGSKKSITQKEEFPKIRSPEYNIDRERSRELEASDSSTSTRNRKYQNTKLKEMESEPSEKAVSLRSEEGAELDEDALEEGEHSIKKSSSRMSSVRGHSTGSRISYTRGTADSLRKQNKKTVQSKATKVTMKADEQTLENFREDVEKKIKREQINQAQKRTRLSFDDKNAGMVKGSGIGYGRKAIAGAATTTAVILHGKLHEAEGDNASVEGVHQSEILAENATRSLRNAQERRMKKSSYSARLNQKEPLKSSGRGLSFSEKSVKEAAEKATNRTAEVEVSKKLRIRRFWQKKQYKDAYVAAKEGKKIKETARAAQSFTVKVRMIAKQVLRRNSGLFIGIGVFTLLFGIISTSLASCSAGVQGFSTTFVGTTYPSTDEDIYAMENAYLALEQSLDEQINSTENRHTGYDEYQYQIDEISHNPYYLVSYFTTKYGEFTYEQIKDELEEIFQEQYGISTESEQGTVTETKTVRVGESLGQVVTSGYCNCSICCGQWSGGPTASGAMPTAAHTIAVDASTPFVPMGTKVVMNGVEYTVEDTGNFTQYGVQFDVYYGDHATASAHGHQTWEAYIADDNGSQEIEVTVTENVNRLNVVLTNHNLDSVLRNRMTEDEITRYELYNQQYGNRSYLFDINSLPYVGSGSDGFGYQIPSEALSDEKFAKMIHEAEKYLGYPYVWGGASPSTSFDCSGFVSWVINNSGNGWNVGRQTAEGLRGCCAYVSPAQAKPGDLIFFQGTYDTAGASHVGIYVGNGMMIHCGNPIKYSSIETAYWQEHFMAFGRLP